MSHPIVTQEEWIDARKKLLAKEKEFTRLRDELGEAVRSLPWTRVREDYVFHGPDGVETLADLFEGRTQLIVYHFMFDPEWEDGCKSCSLLADHYDPAIVHLQQRDVTMVMVSRAPLERFEPFKRRMGWTFKWVSSHGCDFNFDYHVSARPEEVAKGALDYNYQNDMKFGGTELPGISVFFKDDDRTIYHTYSSYARGLDRFLGVYHLLDIVPKGRDEAGLPYGMDWVRHHDRYEESK